MGILDIMDSWGRISWICWTTHCGEADRILGATSHSLPFWLPGLHRGFSPPSLPLSSHIRLFIILIGEAADLEGQYRGVVGSIGKSGVGSGTKKQFFSFRMYAYSAQLPPFPVPLCHRKVEVKCLRGSLLACSAIWKRQKVQTISDPFYSGIE